MQIKQVSMCLDTHLGWGWIWRAVGLVWALQWGVCWPFFCVFFCSVLCLLCLCARLFICALWSPAGKGLTSWLLFVVSNCEFVTFPLGSWVGCGTWLYWLLIFAPLLILLYLMNRYMNFIETCTDTYLGQPKRIIRFWWPRPYLQSHKGYIYKRACLYSIFLTNDQNLTKLTQIIHWEDLNEWLEFVSIDLNSKIPSVT